MALVTRGAAADLEPTSALVAPQVPGSLLVAGAALDKCAPCYIAATGLVHMCDGTAADIKARLAGFTAKAVAIGEHVSLWGPGTLFFYDEAGGMTVGNILYLAATAGRLDTAATTGDAVGVAHVITSKVIRVTRFI